MRMTGRRPSVLWHLYDEGVLSCRELMDLTGWNSSNARGAIENMVQAGLVELCRPLTQPRLYRLTGLGKDAAEQVPCEAVDFAAAPHAEAPHADAAAAAPAYMPVDVAAEIDALMALPEYAGAARIVRAKDLAWCVSNGCELSLIGQGVAVRLDAAQTARLKRFLTALHLPTNVQLWQDMQP